MGSCGSKSSGDADHPPRVPQQQNRNNGRQGQQEAIGLEDIPHPGARPPPARDTRTARPNIARISKQPMSGAILRDGVVSCARALNGSHPYALIGGAACRLLGSERNTADFDMVVPDGAKRATVDALRRTRNFGGDEAGSTRTWYIAPDGNNYNVDILEPASIYQRFDPRRDIIRYNEVNILKPALLLNFKCLSYIQRDKPEKKQNDGADIEFLIEYMASNRLRTSRHEVPFADDDFLDEFLVSRRRTAQFWRAIGLMLPSR